MKKHREISFETENQEKQPEWLKKVYNYYRGDVHAHSRWSERSGVEHGGQEKRVYNEERLLNYADKLGLEFVVLTEHGSDPGAPVELSEEHPICQSLLAEQAKVAELDAADKYKAKAYVGVEASIFFNQDGKAVLDIPDAVLAKLDLVVASRHAITDEREPAKIKESLLAAVNHPEVDVIGHAYRNIEFYQHDWRYFKKYWQNKDKEIYQQLIGLEQAEDWQSIKQIIGKLEPGDNEQIKRLSQMFQSLKNEYWQAWDEILTVMEEKGKVLEINLNAFIPKKEFYITWLKKAAKHKGLNFSIVFDFHSLEQLKDLDKQEPLAELADVKNKGRARALKRLLALLDLLRELEVGPERIINSSRENLDSFLSLRNKKKK